MTEIVKSMDSAIEKCNLLEHPFYQAWSNGSLPSEALTTYAWEYRKFIGKVAEGWDACGYADIANTEREHYDMWLDFAGSLKETETGENIDEVNGLVKSCEDAFATRAGALGALYAFENQQPYTAQSKLKGLRDHYKGLGADETYFEVHVDDFDEPAMLRADIERLSDSEKMQALAACEDVSQKLWDALTGIMKTTAAEA